MIYRRARKDDLKEVERIYSQQADHFDLPITASEVAGVALDSHEGIVGFVMVRRIAETILVLDLERSKKDRILALKVLFSHALFESRIANIDQIHAFVQDPKFSKLLKKHFGFKTCKGEALVLGE